MSWAAYMPYIDRARDGGQQPGWPTWGPFMCAEAAAHREAQLGDLPGLMRYEHGADERKRAWDESIFAPSVDELFAVLHW